MPSCFVGIALPAMLSLMFLPRGFFLDDQWQTALITANGVRDGVGPEWGNLFWIFTLLCVFLVLGSGVTPCDPAHEFRAGLQLLSHLSCQPGSTAGAVATRLRCTGRSVSGRSVLSRSGVALDCHDSSTEGYYLR